jgi:hypothetical protein
MLSGGQEKYTGNFGAVSTIITFPIATNPFTFTKSVRPIVVPPGGSVTYTVRVTNSGPDAAAGVRVVEAPIQVIYPPAHERVTHFDSVKDPARIVARVVKTLVATRGVRTAPADVEPPSLREISVIERAARPAAHHDAPPASAS